MNYKSKEEYDKDCEEFVDERIGSNSEGFDEEFLRQNLEYEFGWDNTYEGQ